MFQILEGVTVVDTAGPTGQLCGRMLADAGATVIKVEPTTGDPVRALQPRLGDDVDSSIPYLFWNGGKRSVAIDVVSAEGQRLLARLVAASDLWITSEDSAIDPGPDTRGDGGTSAIVITGFGSGGPYENFLFSDLTLSAMGGLTSMSGEPGMPPCSPPEFQAYYAASYMGFSAAMGMLWASKSGRATADVEISAREVIASFDQTLRTWGFDGKRIVRNGSQHNRIAPAAVFPTSDGYVHLFVSTKHWPIFLNVWEGHPPDLEDEKWSSNETRRKDADRINAEVGKFIGAHTTEGFVARMEAAGVPCLPVNGPLEVLADEHMQFREVFVQNEYAGRGYTEPRFPMTLDGAGTSARPARALGNDTAEVLSRHLGFGPGELDDLRSRGVVRTAETGVTA